MTKTIIKTSIIMFTVLLNCKATFKENSKVYISTESVTGYNFTSPDRIIQLPFELREISGITPIDTNTFACIQDEMGILYMYDLPSNQIKNEYSFYGKGDFEDITRVGKAMYILRSNATLFEIANYETEPTIATSWILNISADDNEGLCYDQGHDRLLIASKGNAGTGPELKNIREIYAFDLKTRSLIELPVFKFDERVLKQFAVEHKIDVPVKTNKKGESELDIKFRPTAIGIHPITKKLFLLSSPDHAIFIFSDQGSLEYLEMLNPDLFNQPEGLTFLDNGDLIITNEAGDKKPTLFRFNYRK